VERCLHCRIVETPGMYRSWRLVLVPSTEDTAIAIVDLRPVLKKTWVRV
jgi:hypothetical protein